MWAVEYARAIWPNVSVRVQGSVQYNQAVCATGH